MNGFSALFWIRRYILCKINVVNNLTNTSIYFVCLFVCFRISSSSRILHLFEDVTITGDIAANFDICSALMAKEQ
mgnify:CR=1 FL=1